MPIEGSVVGQCAPLVCLQTSYSPRVNVLSRSVSQACRRSASRCHGIHFGQRDDAVLVLVQRLIRRYQLHFGDVLGGGGALASWVLEQAPSSRPMVMRRTAGTQRIPVMTGPEVGRGPWGWMATAGSSARVRKRAARNWPGSPCSGGRVHPHAPCVCQPPMLIQGAVAMCNGPDRRGRVRGQDFRVDLGGSHFARSEISDLFAGCCIA